MALSNGLRLVRTSFSHEKSISWFPGHMMAGLREMRDQMRTVDLVVETRDARIPLSSINKQFEQIIKGKRRVVVYNKADLAPSAIQAAVRQEMDKRGQHVLFTDTSINQSVRQILTVARDMAKSDPIRYPQLVIMVIGMPNVGKSSLINALRRTGLNRGKAANTGAKPGVTRSLSSKIRVLESPPVYLVDTPGVMIPFIPDPIAAIKVALTGGIKDNIADENVLADYLLFRLNRFAGLDYCSILGIERPTDDINDFLQQLGTRIGALRQGGELDTDKAVQFFLRAFRRGRFGQLCLDDLDERSVEEFFQRSLENAPLSKNQSQKAKRAAQRQRSLERARKRKLL
ncbi:Mitochondrial GTPase 1 [Coemansia sp. Cherry 401B]|nr:Mitochondrial GTPase 1 [Coemansia sp. RSA 2705]KAJ2318119.1 Mitochondrial GTPase 1 [Coemansia sp. RSA 2704]KAJ2733767.1 Mitochondrial GTPase 1 [Coemansia sp. Cherry 401B]